MAGTARAGTSGRRPYAARVPMAQRRHQLLDAALLVIDRDGFDRVSIDAIAREAGVTRPVVYGAFDGLDALLLALLDRQQERALTQLYAALPLTADGDLRALVTDSAPALHAMLLADPPTWRAILATPAGLPDDVRDRVAADREGVRVAVATMIAASLGPDADADLVAHALIAVLERFGQLVLADPATYSAQRLAAVVLGFLPR